VFGVGLVPKPSKGCLVRPHGLPGGGRDQATVDRNSEAPVAAAERSKLRSAWEEPGRNPGPGRRRQALEGRSPREQPAVGALIPRPAARDSRKGQSPGAAARWAGLSASADGKTDGKNGMWVLPGGNAPDTF